MPYGDRTVIARTGWEQGHVLWGLLETRLDIAVMVGDEDKLLSPCSCLPSSRLPVGCQCHYTLPRHWLRFLLLVQIILLGDRATVVHRCK